MNSTFASSRLLFLSFTILPLFLLGQNSGDQIFDNDVLHEVRFYFDNSDYWQIMTQNYENTYDGDDVPYLMGNVVIDGVAVDSVGVRFKGFTSYTFENKKPIKIDFNEFVPGKRYDGLRKLNLNNGTGDPGMQRDVVSYDLMRNMGVKAPRTSYSRVYFDDEYWGLYQNIEQVDKEFLQNNFTNDDGNLFKNKGWSYFEWFGNDLDAYSPPFDLKTNRAENDWSGFVYLMDVINNTNDINFKREIQNIFNVDLFLKVLAVDVATNNWDSYIEHGRNWYMYEDIVTKLFHWIPWDYNFSLGGGSFFGGPDDEECFIFPDFISFTNGTTEVKFMETGFSTAEAQLTWDFGDGNSSTDLNPIHNYATGGRYNVCLKYYISEECQDEDCKLIDTSDDPNECESVQNGSFTHEVDFPFVQTIIWLPDCCTLWNEECEEIHENLSNSSGGFGFEDFSVDQTENDGILINRLLNDPQTNDRYYTQMCDLLQNVMLEDRLFDLIDHNRTIIDASVKEDPNFLFDYEDFEQDVSSLDPEIGLKGILSERILNLRLEMDSTFDCPSETSDINLGDIVINEFMASNDSLSGVVDLAGENDDWLELFNNTNSTINLSGAYLSDDLNQLDKWVIPYGTYILPNGYLIIWADEDPQQFGLHSNFKMAKDGGQLILSNSDLSIIDQVDYREQSTNVSAARIPNGKGDFVFQPATFNFNNESSNVKDLAPLVGTVYPNPVADVLNIEFENFSSPTILRLFNASGQLVMIDEIKKIKHQINLSQFANGFYFLQVKDQDGRKMKKKIIVHH